MKIKLILLIYFLCIYTHFSRAQDDRLKYLGIETGMTFIESDMADMDHVRGDVPSYYDGYSSNSLTSLSSKSFIGGKLEIFSLNDRFGLATGIRFSRVKSSVGKMDYWESSTNYFYWLYLQEGVNTEYLKIKEINQTSDYISIPVELRFFPAKRPRLLRIYFKMGAELNYLMQTEKNLVFYNDAMNPYKKDVLAKIGDPKTFYASVYGIGGIRIGKELKPSVSIEMNLPYLFLTPGSFGLVDPIFGGGFQINVQIPIQIHAL